MDRRSKVGKDPPCDLLARCSAWSGPGGKGTKVPYYLFLDIRKGERPEALRSPHNLKQALQQVTRLAETKLLVKPAQ